MDPKKTGTYPRDEFVAFLPFICEECELSFYEGIEQKVVEGEALTRDQIELSLRAVLETQKALLA